MTKKTNLPVELSQWYNDISSVEELRNILSSPVFKTAIMTLKESAGPNSHSLSDDPVKNAMRLSWYAGYRDAFSDLVKLTKFPAKKSAGVEEWDHITLDS